MSTSLIDKVEVVDMRNRTDPGDDGQFVAVQGEERTGWYGPITEGAARYVDAVLADVVVGKSFTDHNVLHRALSQAIRPPANKDASWAIGAVDCAAWDLHGQLSGMPVASMLNPSPSSMVSLYGSWLRLDLSEPSNMDVVAEVGRGGWLFTKWGLRRAAGSDANAEATRLALVAQRAAAALGGAAAFDAVFTWDTSLLMAFVDQFDPATALWLEEPLATLDPDAYRHVGQYPLAIGERLLVGDDPTGLLKLRLRAFTVDVVGCGGLTRAVELVAKATAAGIPVFPHGRSLIPALHLAAAFPQAIAATEYQLQWEPIRQRLYTEPWHPIHGRITLPTTPGLGLAPRNR